MQSDFIDLNLLPHPMRPAVGGPVWRRLALSGTAVFGLALLLILAAFLVKSYNDRQIARQQEEIALVEAQVRDLSMVIREVDILREQVTTLARQAEQLEGDAERVQRENAPLTPFLRALNDALLPRMKITGVTESGAYTFLVQGEAGSSVLVFHYVNALKEQPGIRDVTPQAVEQLGGDYPPGTVRWTLLIER